jgi:ribose/xylose/arabinose/galactoside ABC-type transport system permease subunit
MEKPKIAPMPFSPANVAGLVLAILLLAAYFVLPFVNQPELGATTAPAMLADSKNNELEVPLNGLPLIPMAGIIALVPGLWSVLNPKTSRAMSFFVAVAAIVSLAYYVIFFMEASQPESAFLGSMGISFWVMLLLSIGMIAQVFLPRPPALPQYSLRKMLSNQESIILFALIGMVLLVGISSPRFVGERNLTNLLHENAYIAVAAIGMAMVIITGNIDISVGSLMGLLAVVCGRLSLIEGMPMIVAWTVPVLIGMVIGAGIGFTVAYLRVPAIVVTLGMLSILKGILILWAQGERVVDMPPEYFLAQMKPLGIPMPVYFMIALTIVAALWMRYSVTGRSFYAVGGNKEAARLSGLSEPTIIIQAFTLNGLFAGIASVLYATQLQTIQATPQPNVELLIISSAVVGGVSILGGVGTVIGATLAAIFLNVIRSAMIFINVSAFWLQAVQGILILLTVLADLFRRRRQAG